MPGKLNAEGTAEIGSALELARGLCTPMRFPRSGCRACVDACTIGALGLKKGTWSLAATCDSCGACAGACPTGAMDVRSAPAADLELRVRKRLRAEPGEAVRFACEKVADAPRGTIRVACAAQIEESLLVGAALGGASEVVVAVAACESCSRAERFRRTFPQALRWARAILAASGGNPASFRLVEGAAEKGAPDAGRRDFLRSLGRSFTAAVAAASQVPESEVPAAGRRGRLVAALKASGRKLAPVPAEGFPLGILSIDLPSCTGCTACAHVCPTEAIERREDSAGTVQVSVTDALCTACGACAEACFTRAVRVAPAADLAALAPRAPRPLARLARVWCAGCGGEFHSAGPDRCPRCRPAVAACP